MSTSPAREFHGRDAELALIRAELERLSDGAEAVVVVECAAGARFRAAARPAAAAGARSAGVAISDLDRRRPLGRQRNGRGDSHTADATDGIADRVGDRSSPAARSDTAPVRARTAEARGG